MAYVLIHVRSKYDHQSLARIAHTVYTSAIRNIVLVLHNHFVIKEKREKNPQTLKQ